MYVRFVFAAYFDAENTVQDVCIPRREDCRLGKDEVSQSERANAIHCLSLIDVLTICSLLRGGMFWGFLET